MSQLRFGAPEEGKTVVSGSVEAVIYSNDENGYTVLRLRQEEGGVVTLVGTLPYAAPGESLTAEGSWSTHSAYGDQFKADYIERLMPASIAGI